jgi:hypothetical protein
MKARPAWLAVFAGLLVVLAGCGVPAERDARAVDVPLRGSSQPPAPAQNTGPAEFGLYLVRDGMLVKVERHESAVPGPGGVLESLLAGPTLQERETGITSALLGTTVLATVAVSGGQANVELGDTTLETGRTDDVLAYGQIVCTLSTLDGVRTVSFTQAGLPLRVPRGDGPLTQEPLTLADYANLIAG